jgi:hypothetical protein
MPSSTFSSDGAGAQVAAVAQPHEAALAAKTTSAKAISAKAGIVCLLAGLVIIFAGLEFSSPAILAQLSNTERRINGEMRDAQALQSTTQDGRPTVLLVGNSLLLEGVQLEALRNDLASQYAVSRLGIEQTHYLDWYFGLRRLLAEGAHPNLIVLSLATDQLASALSLGESFAHRQMLARDLPRVVRDGDLDRTAESSYFFAHWSNWLGDKGFIRQCVMILLVPHFRQLAGRIADHDPRVDDATVLVDRAKQRLPELHDLAQQYGVQIVVLVPPSLRDDHSAEIQDLGKQVGVPVWVLSRPGEFPRQLYRDGFHLNAQGSAIFTERLSQRIRDSLADRADRGDAGASSAGVKLCAE